MFKSYLRNSFGGLRQNRSSGFLNIAGLAIGIACAGLIFLWVEDEISFDNFNQKKQHLYFVRVNQVYDTYTASFYSTPGVLAPAMQEEIPGIANTCRVTEDDTRLLFTIDDKSIYASGKYAEPSLFSMFTVPFVAGDAQTAFSYLHSLVITEETAKKFFGTKDPGDYRDIIGKTVLIDHQQDYVITGVLKDIPENSSLQFEWLAPFKVFYDQSPWAQRWGNLCLSTYVELKDGANPGNINKELYNYIPEKQGSPEGTTHAFLFPMDDWRLYDQFDNGVQTGGGRIEYVRLFTVIAWIILLIACINFMNLATARSEKRAKEVGVRKVLGAGRARLALRFVAEALFMSAIAAILAIVIIALALPAFNQLTQKSLAAGPTNPRHWIALVLVIVTCGLVAGSYPSLYLSSFKPVFVLKGVKIKTGSATLIRKGLVITQFTVSIILIISTILIYQQINHVKSRNLGFDKNNLLQISLQGDMLKNFAVIKQDLLNTGLITNAALSDHETIYGGNNTGDLTWQGKDPNSNILISQRLVSPEFISTSGMHIVEGRDFKSTDVVEMGDDFQPKDQGQIFNVIITRSLEKLMGKGSAIGKTLQLPRGKDDTNFDLRVIGVIEDYVYGYMYGTSDPVVFYCIPQATTLLYVRMKSNADAEQTLAKMQDVMKKDNAAYPFEYRFVDDQFSRMFASEMLISKLSRLFAALTILISCLGLFGLSAYTAERRTKEIGIRKVLGASVTGITGLLSKDFMKLIGFAAIVAFPLAWWIMHNWLQNYQYRITISWWVFVTAGTLALIIALLTISFQAMKAALANPVKSLRNE